MVIYDEDFETACGGPPVQGPEGQGARGAQGGALVNASRPTMTTALYRVIFEKLGGWLLATGDPKNLGLASQPDHLTHSM